MMNHCSDKTDSILLAIPVYNEQDTLTTVLNEAARYVNHIVVIDDGSTDDTPLLLARRKDVCIVRHQNNCGYGCSILHALQMGIGCGFEWVITMDCDWQHEPAQIPCFMKAIRDNDADIISGSRYLDASQPDSHAPEDRRVINRTITRMLQEHLGLNLTDSFCGFKACRTSAMQRLHLTEAEYAFPLQFWVQAVHHGLRICEIPIRLIYNNPNRSFGAHLDDPQTRLRHYEDVFRRSIDEAGRTVAHPTGIAS